MRDGKATPVRIRTGLTDGKNTEVIAGGLEAGDQVIVADAATEKAEAQRAPQQPSRGRGRGGRRGPPSVF
jgi:hypothetical protein